MFFDRNQSDFISEKQRIIWQYGTHIVPLEVSLADVDDNETREACVQIYDCVIEILTDMYNNPEEYSEHPRQYTGYYLVCLANCENPTKKHSEEYSRYLKIIPRFGFIYNEDIGRWSNERFPLLFEYFPRFTQLDNERKKCLGGYIERLDFRIFAKKVKLTIDDILHPLPDAEREYCFEMHNHALSKGLKVQIKDPYCIRYIYKRLYSLEISNNPFRITVSYRLDNGKRVEDQFDRFFDVMNAQPDKDELIEYLKGGIRVCDACGGKKKPNERCGKWVELNGSRRLISMCLSSVSKYRRGLRITDYNEDDIRILKRMLDIRIIQIDKYLSDCEYR